MSNEKFEAMYIGRFQPFHNGHLHAIKAILRECENVLIVIGSSSEFGTEKNPFSYELRLKMITQTLQANNILDSRYKIVPLPDIHNDDKWVSYLVDTVPSFQFVYTGSEIVRGLFIRDGRFAVREVDFLEGVSGSLVRKFLCEKKDISKYVSKETSGFVYL